MATGGNNRINFQVGFNVDQGSLNQVSAAFEKIRNFKPASFSGTEKLLRDIKNLALKVENALNKAFNTKLNSVNISAFKKLLGDLNLNQIYTDFNKLGATGQAAFNSMSTSILTSNLNLKQTSSFIQNIGTTLMNTVKWTVASSAIKAFTGSISQAFTYVKSLDSSLNDIRIVTKDSADLMANFAAQANRAASELGRSTLDYTKAALTFYQQGLDDEAVQARTQAVLKAQNITGAGSEMADYLTAVWNGYKVVNEEAELYVDKLAAVADSSASNMSLIAIAMSKVSSAANSLGVDVDSLTAQIATIVATTRLAPESVGNALKTIYARINDISVGADDAEVTLGNYSTQMRSVGINVLDANGRLRDTGDVIDEVGEKWSTLSREQQIFLARTMAGQRQYNKLISLFDNWSKYTDLVTVSMLAQGATELKNAIYMESLAAHTEQLGAAQLRLKSSMVDSDSYKNLIDVATSGVTLFANFIESIGGGGNALLMLGSTFVSVFSGTIAKEINNVITNMRNMQENALIVKNAVSGINELAGVGQGSLTAARELLPIKDIYGALTNLQRLQLNNLLVIETKLENRVNILKLQKTLAEALRAKMVLAMAIDPGKDWGNFAIQIDNIKTVTETMLPSLKRISNNFNALRSVNTFNDLKDKIETVNNALGGSNEKLAEVNEKLQKITAGTVSGWQDTTVQNYVNEIRQAILSVKNDLNMVLPDNIDNITLALQLSEQAAKNTQEAIARYKNLLRSEFNTQAIIKGVAGLGQMASALNSVINLTKIWNNENLSTGLKLLQTFMNLSMILTMLTSGFSKFHLGLKAFTSISTALADTRRLAQLNLITAQKGKQAAQLAFITAEKKVQSLINSDITELIIKENGLLAAVAEQLEKRLLLEKAITEEKKAQAGVNDANGLADDSMLAKLTTKIKGLGSSITTAFSTHPVLAWGAVALVTIGGIIAYVSSLPSELEKAKELADRLNQVAKDNYTAFSSLSSAIQTISSDFKQLADAENTLNGLTIGTEEWATQLNSVNQQVTLLILKYPQLKEFLLIDANGQLGFKEGARLAVLSGLKQQREAAAAGYVSAERSASEALNKVSIALTAEKIGRSSALVSQALNILNSQGLSAFSDLRSTFLALGIDILTASNSERDLVYAIFSNQEEIVKLNNTISSNNQKTDNLIATMVKTSTDFTQFEGFNGIASEIGQEAYKNAFANRVANLGLANLDSKYFDTRVNNITGTLRRLLNMDRVVLAYEKQLSEAFNTAIDIQEGEDGTLFYLYAGKKNELTTEGIIAGLAYFENKDKLSDEVAKQIQGFLDTGLESAFALDKDKNGNVKVDLSKLTSGDITELAKHTNELADALGVSTWKVAKALLDAQGSLETHFNNFVKGLDPAIQQAFAKNGIDSSYTQQVAQSFANLLQKALDNNDIDSFNFLNKITEGLNNTLLSAFTELANSIDYSTITAGELETKLHEAGIETDYTTLELQKYIEAQRKAAGLIADPYAKNKSIADIVGNLQQGGTLDPVQYAKLTALDEGFSQFFKRTIDGTWELIATTDLFKKAVLSIKLDNLQKQIDENNTKIQQLGNVNTRATGTGDKLNALDAFGVNTASLKIQFNSLDLQEASEAIAAIDKAYQELGLTEEKVIALQEVLREENKELIEVVDRAKEKVLKFNLDADVNKEKWENLTEYLRDYANLIELVADSVQDNQLVAQLLAELLLRFDAALESVSKNYLTWKKELTSGAILDQVKATNELQNVYSDLLDLPFENLSPDFLKDTSNLELLKQVLDGDADAAEDAYNKLMDLAQADIEVQVGINLNDEDFNNVATEIQSALDQIHFDDLEIGANLDDANLIAQLLRMVNLAGMTAEQATDYLASMGIDATIKTVDAPLKSYQEYAADNGHWLDRKTTAIVSPDGINTQTVELNRPVWVPAPYSEYELYKANFQGFALEVEGAHKKSGGGFKYSNSTHGGGSGKSGGGKKGGGSKKSPKKKSKKKGSKKKKKEEKTVDKDLGLENKLLTYDPYEKVTKLLERQSDQLEKLQKQEDKLTGKDRLANLQKQNKTLQKQNQLLRQRQAISDDANKKNTTAWFKKQLKTTTSFKNIIKFDPDGQISDIAALLRKAEQTYNNTVKNADKNYEAVEKKYNNYIKKYNKMSAKKQESSKVQKELLKWKEALKEAEETAKNAQKAAEDKYKLDTELIKSYTEALEKDNEARQNWLDNLDKITEIKFAKVKIGVDLSLEMGLLERDWLDFEDKFIKRLGKDDFLGQAQSSSKKLFSFFDTNLLEDQVKMVKELKSDIAILNKGLKTTESSNKIKDLLGISAADWAKMTAELKLAARQAALAMKKEDLLNYLKTLQNSLTTMQEQADAIRDSVLSGLDKAKSDMDDQISQFERVNSLIEHGAKLSEMLFGEKAYDNAVKFYNMQKENNIKLMQRIALDRAYWENIYQQQRLADDDKRDELLMQKALSNLQAFDDQLRSTLEEIIDILHNEWESKVQSTLQKMNNTLTSGYGLDFANEEWDYVTKFDDYFLDNVESKMGIEEIERLFDNASKAAAGDANAQARLSKIYQEQMKTLRNKEKLTQYDIDRAKKMLEIEQARLAIEKAREQKTTMRLRRDSQGNYTYRYVADEDLVADLADKLANLEYNLYEDDKNQYKKNLNQMLSFYEDYQKKMMELEWELQQAKNKGDEALIERMQKRIDALKEYGLAMGDNLALNQDWITSTYWTQSTADSLGIENYTRLLMLETMADNIPIVGVALQLLDKNIRSAGGFLEALAPFEKEITTASQEYAAALTSAMDAAQTSTAAMTADIDKAVNQTTKIVDNYDTIINKTKEEVDEVGRMLQNVNEAMEKLRSGTELMKELYNSYYSIQNLNLLNAADDKNGTDLVSRVGLTSTTLNEKMENLWAEWKEFYKSLLGADEMATGGYTGAWGDDGRVAVLHEKELVLNAEDTSNLLAAVGAVRDITSRMSIAGALDSLAASQAGLLNTLYNQHSQLDQNVHIEANFPNVTQHTEIEQAFENLVNIASMHASKRVD